ncbi:hypothetical protein KDW98_12315 [Burkholderia vietnamiensis]|uniref:hypothetical protein n=1 Tax=Burkholderia vietnamiensis TaxID=60552 RepID=UPI001B9D7472|nr:hypothetical protein [Burkholderia vietnamiensis]MBR8161948.1 hypothetical protein [Burkholderia vietnamiensis]
MPTHQNDAKYGARTDSDLFALLGERASDCGQKSMTARLAAVIEIVEAILARGYDRAQVLALLINAGWYFTPDSFDSALSRVRKRRVKGSCNPQNSNESQSSEHNSAVPPFADLFASTRKNWKGR